MEYRIDFAYDLAHAEELAETIARNVEDSNPILVQDYRVKEID